MTDMTRRLKALAGLDADIQRALLAQVRDLWTHGSTAIEGNTLTLGETKFVIEEGLTVSGKPLKDHQEVVGHARAIDLVYDMLDAWPAKPVTEAQLFDLHRAVQTGVVIDIYKPIGDWKLEPNGTYAVTDDGRQTFIEFATPADVPTLMRDWLAELNRLGATPLDEDSAIAAYAHLHLGLVHIHPFWDGNGRMARLLANLPVLRAGFLPVVIDVRERRRYIDTLAAYQLAVGQVDEQTGVWPQAALEVPFVDFCRDAYASTRALIAAARARQAKRAPTARN
jgi:Fic family protein